MTYYPRIYFFKGYILLVFQICSITTIMRRYETFVTCDGLIRSSIGGKEKYLLAKTRFGICIDELDSFLIILILKMAEPYIMTWLLNCFPVNYVVLFYSFAWGFLEWQKLDYLNHPNGAKWIKLSAICLT